MIIEVTRKYRIDFPGTAVEFIGLVDRTMRLTADMRLDSLDMGDAVYAATQLYDQGDLTNIVEPTDEEFNYIDCPDKDTLVAYNYYQDKYFKTKAGLDPAFCMIPGCGCTGQAHP